MPKRLPDWQSRLARFLEERREMPFAYGTNDCSLFAADAVLAMTGHDPAEGLRSHTNQEEAESLIEANGGLFKLAGERFGEAIPPLMAAVGDVGFVRTDAGYGLALCNGDTWLVPTAQGLQALPMAVARRAWRAV